MKPSQLARKRRAQAKPEAEAMEARQLLTGGAGNTIALIPQVIDKPGGAATVEVKIDPTVFKASRQGSILLGIDVAPQSTSTAKPRIKSVTLNEGGTTAATNGRSAVTKTKTVALQREAKSTAVLVPVSWNTKQASKPIAVRTKIVGQKGTTGNLLVGYYLPGDVNGDGTVDRADIKVINKAMGGRAGDTKYDFDSDANRDGVIDARDKSLAQQNLGASSVVTPVVTADIEKGAIVGNDRSTTKDSITFSGIATPGASISYVETQNRVPIKAAIVDGTGKYSITVPLAVGSNTFRVTTNDPFGQSISGTITPVVRKA